MSSYTLPADSVQAAGGVCSCASAIVPPADLSALLVGADSSVLGGYFEKYYGAYESYCKLMATVAAASAVSPPVVSESLASDSQVGFSPEPSVVGSVRSVSSGASSRSSRRAASWRARFAVRMALPEGCCYARLFSSRARDYVISKLGPYPTMASLLTQPADVSVSSCLVTGMRVVPVPLPASACSPGSFVATAYHVVESSALLGAGAVSYSLLDALSGLAKRSDFPEGTLGSRLRTELGPSVSSAAYSLLSPLDVLGGLDPAGSGVGRSSSMSPLLGSVGLPSGLVGSSAHLPVGDLRSPSGVVGVQRFLPASDGDLVRSGDRLSLLVGSLPLVTTDTRAVPVRVDVSTLVSSARWGWGPYLYEIPRSVSIRSGGAVFGSGTVLVLDQNSCFDFVSDFNLYSVLVTFVIGAPDSFG